MSKVNTPNQAAAGWTSTQAYVMAVICLLIGVAVGYFVRGSASATPATAASVESGAQSGMAPAGGQPSPEQMKHMADKQVEPLVAQLQTKPNDPELLAQIGNVYYDAQVYRSAVDYYERSLKLKADNPNVRTDMGTAYYYMGDADRALQEFDTALKYDPKHEQTMFNMGMVKWQAKMDGPGALAAWEKLLAMDPNYPEKARVETLIAQVKQHQSIKPGSKTEKPAM